MERGPAETEAQNDGRKQNATTDKDGFADTASEANPSRFAIKLKV
jgi:hypothetical protein